MPGATFQIERERWLANVSAFPRALRLSFIRDGTSMRLAVEPRSHPTKESRQSSLCSILAEGVGFAQILLDFTACFAPRNRVIKHYQHVLGTSDVTTTRDNFGDRPKRFKSFSVVPYGSSPVDSAEQSRFSARKVSPPGAPFFKFCATCLVEMPRQRELFPRLT
jgi:hypothetical protein